MNKTERLMFSAIYEYANVVPNFRNNMDMAGYATFRHDFLEVANYISKLSYALLMYSTPNEDKGFWKDEYYDTLEQLKKFVTLRKNEGWSSDSNAEYTTSVSGW